MKCPAGYVKRANQCVRVIDTPNTKRKTSAKKEVEQKKNQEQIKNDSLISSDPYAEFYRIGRIIQWAWDGRPDAPVWVKRNVPGLLSEAAEEVINLQFQAAALINQGVTANKDQYSTVERERTESIGFKPIYSPGAFVV